MTEFDRFSDWKPGKSASGESDIRRALGMAEALGMEDDVRHAIVIPGAPWSKSRPRFARNGHAYKDKKDEDAEERTGWYLKRAVGQPYQGNVALACVFYRPNRQRIDTDNLIKHVCDAANGVVWIDDSQCTAVMGVIELDEGNPRTVVIVGRHVSTLTRGEDATYPCAVCGKPISHVGQSNKTKTCSRACSMKVRGIGHLAEPVPCAHCGNQFKRFTTAQKYCSTRCAGASKRGVPRGIKVPYSTCSDCGAQLSHRRGGRCRECWKKHKREMSKEAA